MSKNTRRFITKFARSSRKAEWLRSLDHIIQLSRLAISEFERVQREGLPLSFERGPFVSAFRSRKAAKEQLADLMQVASRGVPLQVTMLDRAELIKREPLTRAAGQYGVVLENQGLVQPPLLLKGLRDALQRMGVEFVPAPVCSVETAPNNAVHVVKEYGERVTYDRVVISSGAWLNQLARAHGVRTQILAGFGYSLRVDVPELPEGMLYFPEAKIATTRMAGSLRISTLLQIDEPESKLDPRGIRRLKENARVVLPMADWSSARQVWRGGRPISNDGMPIVGETWSKNIYVNGGHGMWGVTLAPVSGRLLAEAIFDDRSDIDIIGLSARR